MPDPSERSSGPDHSAQALEEREYTAEQVAAVETDPQK